MAVENPPLNRIYVLGYAANDRDYPIVSMNLDPRVAGYKVPEDLSACPDKRYPNHVFTGAQPISGDERVRHVWEILPSPYVPFTRYDDDLGPVQGRRRSVKNEGQVAVREADKQVTYEAREGSAIVYTELEETWSIKTDEDGNSLFPIRDRDFYDASRGPVQERRQLLVPTGEEEGSLENVNGTITQTSYEPYNEFLSVKIVQTYKVDGPQLIGKSTDNEGQLVTITTQRKGAQDYVPPNPTATRTVEANREDAESIVERIVDTPQVFGAEVYRKTREDLTPQKFRAAQRETTSEQNVAGTATSSITLESGEFAKSEQQVSKFIKRVSTTTRPINTNATLVEKVLTNEGQVGTRTLILQTGNQSLTPSATTVDGSVEALGDGRTVKSETIVPKVFDNKTLSVSKPDVLPERFRASVPAVTTQETVKQNSVSVPELESGDLEKSETRVTDFKVRKSTTTRDVSEVPELNGIDYEESFDVQVPYTEKISTALPSGSAEAVPLDSERYLVREYDKDDIESYLDSFLQTHPTTISMKLPRVLESVDVEWDEKEGEGSYENAPFAGGVLYQFSSNDKGEASSFSSATPLVSLNFKDVWSNNIPATVHIFFLKNPVTEAAILEKTNSEKWPTFKTKSHVITGKGVEIKAFASAATSVNVQQSKPQEFGVYADQSKQKDFSRSITPITIDIPPCLHGFISIGEAKSLTATVNVAATTASYSPAINALTTPNSATISDVASITGTLLPTSPTDIPSSGTYLIESGVDFFKYGFSIVRATTIDASVFA